MDEMILNVAGTLGAAQGQSAPPPWASMVPLVLLFAVFYFLLIRPQQKRQKEHQQMLESIRKGDQIVTSGGLLGVVTNVKENTFTVRIADGVKVEITKNSVASVTRPAGGEERTS